MNPRELFGREVLDVNARGVGKVVDMDFDMHQGVINNIVVKAGALKKYVVTFDKIAKTGDKIILNVSQDTLERLA